MTPAEFIAEVRRRRNHFVLWWIGAPVPIFALRWIFDHLPKSYFTFDPAPVFALATWFLVWLWLIGRFCGMTCLHCSSRAFGYRPFFRTSNLRCQSCGASLSKPN